MSFLLEIDQILKVESSEQVATKSLSLLNAYIPHSSLSVCLLGEKCPLISFLDPIYLVEVVTLGSLVVNS